MLNSRNLNVAAGAIAAVASITAPSYAGSVNFGSGANQFTMDFVTIGNPGNAADTWGNPNAAGSVGYTYDIGKFEVSENMITKYNAIFGSSNSLVITKDTRGTNKPATSITWNEAARFVNWLNTSTGNQAAYKFTTSGVNDNLVLWSSVDAGYNANNQYRNNLAKYFLPNYNEWYKAAYYDPNQTRYWAFTTGSDDGPESVTSGTLAGTAVINHAWVQGPADVTQAGGLSAFGVMGLGGNVWEWEESTADLLNNSPTSARVFRGGAWNDGALSLRKDDRPLFNYLPSDGDYSPNLGFRVASLPSSSTTTPVPGPLPLFGAAAGFGWSRRLRSRIRRNANTLHK
ncbi:MAG: formylglycine-generating enzyme family protein [Cyanobacteriota bacterium]